MEDFKSARCIALYDSCAIIKNTYTDKDGKIWDYEHSFHETDLGSFSFQGFDLRKIFHHLDIDVPSPKIENEQYTFYRDIYDFGKEKYDNFRIVDLLAKVSTTNFLDIRIIIERDDTKEIIPITYCGKFTVEWMREIVQETLGKSNG